jgi:hypothetical protein
MPYLLGQARGWGQDMATACALLEIERSNRSGDTERSSHTTSNPTTSITRGVSLVPPAESLRGA